MPTCPSCKQHHEKRASGRCPSCDTPVEMYQGFWFETGQGSPTAQIVDKFELLVSKSQSIGKQVNFRFPRKSSSYKRELRAASNLLKHADGDLPLILKSLDYLFNHPKFSWKTRNTLMWVMDDFNLAMALVRADEEKQRAQEEKDKLFLQSILQKEDIFSR